MMIKIRNGSDPDVSLSRNLTGLSLLDLAPRSRRITVDTASGSAEELAQSLADYWRVSRSSR